MAKFLNELPDFKELTRCISLIFGIGEKTTEKLLALKKSNGA
jgi:hypothetical protein